MLPHAQIKYPTGKIFYQLLSLELRAYSYEWWNLLWFMLDSSPKLQILKLVDVSHFISQLNFVFLPVSSTFKYFNCIVLSHISFLKKIVRWAGNGVDPNVFLNVCCFILRHLCGQDMSGNEKMRKQWLHTSLRMQDA